MSVALSVNAQHDTEGRNLVRHTAPPSGSPTASPLSSTHAALKTAAPIALDSAALYAARRRFGKNEIDTSILGKHHFLFYTVVSPTMVLVVGELILNLSVSIHYRILVLLLYILVVHVVVTAHAAQTSLKWITALHRRLPHNSAVAYREGTWALVDTAQLVPGDLIQFVQGSTVHADCTLYRGSLLLDLSQLTGRSGLVQADVGHLLKAGSVVVDGSGDAVVRYTGHETFAGQTVRLLRYLAPSFVRPPVQRIHLLLVVTALVVVVTVEVVLYGLLRGFLCWSLAQLAWAMWLVAWVCLPLNVDLAVLQAVTSGAGHAVQCARAIVLRLGALLSLASVDVVVVDKSGTLTTGVYAVGSVFRSFSPQYPSRDSLVQLAALATKWREASPHAMRRAVLRCADLDQCDQYTRLAYVEHDGAYRTSTVLCQANGALLRVTEGQVQAVLALLNRTGAPGGSGSGGDGESKASGPSMELARVCAEALQLEMMWGYNGLRTRAVAVGRETGPWQLAGLVTFEDTLRADAADFVQACEEAGVTVTVASGDAKAVVATAAAAVLPTGSASRIMTGGELPSFDMWQILNASSLAGAAASSSSVTADLRLLQSPLFSSFSAADLQTYARCRVYAEMLPEHKVSLVRLLQCSGLRVGMLGDGVNDAAAAQVADVGMSLVTPEKGSATASQGALWGADIALPSTRLTAASELLRVSREVFATVYYLYFYSFTVTLQLTLLLCPASFVSVKSFPSYNIYHYSWEFVSSPVNGRLPFLVFLTVTCLLFQARQQGDGAYWAAAPCHPSYRVAAIQSACMAVIGAGGGVPLALAIFVKRHLPQFLASSLGNLWCNANLWVMYLFYLQVFLSLTCASPARCGLCFLARRAVYLVVCLVLVGLWVHLFDGFVFWLQLLLLPYVIAISALQDAAKLGVHRLCYCRDFFGYRGCVDHMAGRRHREREDAEAGHDVAARDDASPRQQQQQQRQDEEDEEETPGMLDHWIHGNDPAADAPHSATRPFSAVLNYLLGYLVPLETRLLRVVPPGPPISAAAAAAAAAATFMAEEEV